jgi:hypothetical protein
MQPEATALFRRVWIAPPGLCTWTPWVPACYHASPLCAGAPAGVPGDCVMMPIFAIWRRRASAARGVGRKCRYRGSGSRGRGARSRAPGVSLSRAAYQRLSGGAIFPFYRTSGRCDFLGVGATGFGASYARDPSWPPSNGLCCRGRSGRVGNDGRK